MKRGAVTLALASAALFGISTPASKALLGQIHPIILAGLLYCGAGIGIAILRRVATRLVPTGAPEVSLKWSDVPWLAGAIGFGGIAGPILLMVGLTRTDASTASLLLTVEGAATASSPARCSTRMWIVGSHSACCALWQALSCWLGPAHPPSLI